MFLSEANSYKRALALRNSQLLQPMGKNCVSSHVLRIHTHHDMSMKHAQGTRDVVLEASARLEVASRQFFSWLGLTRSRLGLASVSTLLPRPWLCLIVSASVLARSGK